MRNLIMKSAGTITIALFLLSLTPLSMLHMDKELQLSEVIQQLQELQQATEKPSINFKVIFANTVTALKTAAGLKNAIAKQSAALDKEKSMVIISVRLPYMLPGNCTVQMKRMVQTLPSKTRITIYNCHIITPELPPPIVVFS